MCHRNTLNLRAVLVATIISLLVNIPASHGQQASPKKPASQDEDVLRIKTELVQTDLMVFDKQGHFVDGLRPEQFELSLDGKQQQISAFERVISGSRTEASQLATAQAHAVKSNDQDSAATDRRRIIFFFLDDLHLSETSLTHARTALADFVENHVSPNDQLAIVSASGQIGFLQQLTDNKAVLRAAIDRLNYKRNTETFGGKTVITEYEANQMAVHGDKDLFNYIVSSTINEYQLYAPSGGDARGLGKLAANMVRNRTSQINAQSRATTNDTLSVLLGLMRSSASLPGRKLAFLISDGFISDPRNSYVMDMLRQVGRMAAQAGIVVYTMDARGTFSDPAVDAGRNDFPDGMASGTSARMPSLESSAMREPLRILADDTGGRAILNSNSFTDAFQQAIDETSSYYLLAWRPENDEQRSGKARIKVSVRDHPELRVRLRRNYYLARSAEKATREDEKKVATAAAGTAETELLSALGSVYPRGTIPTTLSVGYVDQPDGLALKASMQIDRAALDLSASESKKAEVDVIGAAVDDRGIIVSFKQLLTVSANSSSSEHQEVVWNQQLKVRPGLYQVRVAVRERSSGRTGSAQQWIEVPDPAKRSLHLSSLFLGERTSESTKDPATNSPGSIMIDVDHRFARTSILRFQTYVYNAARDPNPPAIEIQARILRNSQAVLTIPGAHVPIDTTRDLTRLPYWAEIALDGLPPGMYILQISAVDRTTGATAIQQANFIIE